MQLDRRDIQLLNLMQDDATLPLRALAGYDQDEVEILP
ncbi:hypothetical protein LBM341_02379 [Ralstonia solanacearum]|nr:hypothetical protein LBM341_02379 [Ralstonia solanacearum]